MTAALNSSVSKSSPLLKLFSLPAQKKKKKANDRTKLKSRIFSVPGLFHMFSSMNADLVYNCYMYVE